MRPEDFSPGNISQAKEELGDLFDASMRPEDFSPGNSEHPSKPEHES